MKHKKLHDSRIRNYYIEAAIEIIKHQDIKNASIRHIAEKAGYSFATTYNYFKNNKELLYLCISEFLKEFEATISYSKGNTDALGKIKHTTIQYINYLTKFPGIFDLLYLEDFSNIEHKEFFSEIYNYANHLCTDEWITYSNEMMISNEHIERLKLSLHTFIIGYVVLYNKRNLPFINHASIVENLDFIFR